MGTFDDGSVARRRSGDLNEKTPYVSHKMDDKSVAEPRDGLFICSGHCSDEVLGDLDA